MTNATQHYLDRHVDEGHGDRRAVSSGNQSWTYGDLLNLVERAADALSGAGVGHGDRVLIVLPDSLEAVTFLLASMRVGAAPAPVHTQMSDDDLAFVCEDCRPAAAVVTPERLARIQRIQARLGSPSAVFVTGDRVEGALSARSALESAGRRGPAKVGHDDMALLQYTSGSTGVPKGVVHLHGGLLALRRGFGRRLALTADDVCYSAAKLYFGYGLGNSVLLPFGVGASSVLRTEPSDPLGVFETIHRSRPSIVFAGPALYTAMLAIRGAASKFDLTGVRLFVSAGEALGASVFERWEQTFGHGILDGLGSTECLHVFIAGEPGRLRPGSLGTVVPPYEVRLLDDAGTPVAAGEVGHLYVSGPANGARYLNRPDLTLRTMGGAWIRTGDLLVREDDGSFRYVGRGDDVFKVRGMKVFPSEVETLLNSHPSIAESAVVAGIDRHGLTVACAFVRLAPQWEPSPELARALRVSLRQSLSPHKLPRLIEFVDELPRSSTGKLARYKLSEPSGAAR